MSWHLILSCDSDNWLDACRIAQCDLLEWPPGAHDILLPVRADVGPRPGRPTPILPEVKEAVITDEASPEADSRDAHLQQRLDRVSVHLEAFVPPPVTRLQHHKIHEHLTRRTEPHHKLGAAAHAGVTHAAVLVPGAADRWVRACRDRLAGGVITRCQREVESGPLATATVEGQSGACKHHCGL